MLLENRLPISCTCFAFSLSLWHATQMQRRGTPKTSSSKDRTVNHHNLPFISYGSPWCPLPFLCCSHLCCQCQCSGKSGKWHHMVCILQRHHGSVPYAVLLTRQNPKDSSATEKLACYILQEMTFLSIVLHWGVIKIMFGQDWSAAYIMDESVNDWLGLPISCRSGLKIFRQNSPRNWSSHSSCSVLPCSVSNSFSHTVCVCVCVLGSEFKLEDSDTTTS